MNLRDKILAEIARWRTRRTPPVTPQAPSRPPVHPIAPPAPSSGRGGTVAPWRSRFLFAPDVGGHDRTLTWWTTRHTEASREAICRYLHDCGSNAIVTLIRCVETDMSLSTICGLIRGAEGQRFARWGLAHIPVYLSDDHGPSFADSATGHENWIHDLGGAYQASPAKHPLLVVGLELGEHKWWHESHERAGWLSQEIRHHAIGSGALVGVHIQPSQFGAAYLTAKADVILQENSWHPRDGGPGKPFEAEWSALQRKFPDKKLIAAEYAMDSAGEWASGCGKYAMAHGAIGALTGF